MTAGRWFTELEVVRVRARVMLPGLGMWFRALKATWQTRTSRSVMTAERVSGAIASRVDASLFWG
jgi:hypothetical protein